MNDRIKVIIKPTTLIIALPIETVFIASFSVILHSFAITQNPLSFIQENVMDPAAIAVRIYTGFTVRPISVMMGASIADTVIMDVALEP